MPRYSTATKKKKRGKRKMPKRLPKDPDKLLRWAGTGTEKDYDKLRKLAVRAGVPPSYIDGKAVEILSRINRLTMIEQIQAAEEHDVSAGGFLDAVNWVLDKVPWGNWAWPLSAAQSVINAQKGDGLNLVDEQYARLVGATYGSVEDRPFVLDHWKRQTQFDSSYVSVWDNFDGHRVICVRGTQGAGDIAEDLLVGFTGRSTNLIGNDLLQILAATPETTVVDLAAHSLGTSLALQAYMHSSDTYHAVHETYLYNPAYSPLLKGSADVYERDSRVRYFVNFKDPISMGGMGHRAPSNVVYRSGGNLLTSHKLSQWQGSGVHHAQYHAPPETRMHAHKALFGDKPWETPYEDQLKLPNVWALSTVIGSSDNTTYDKEHKIGIYAETPAGPAEPSDAAEPADVQPAQGSQPFDFGHEYDWGAL